MAWCEEYTNRLGSFVYELSSYAVTTAEGLVLGFDLKRDCGAGKSKGYAQHNVDRHPNCMYDGMASGVFANYLISDKTIE